ncbi:UNVERIFIED_CONTAM: hypothetical protein PYX00_011077 [Menopon gallinae]|uniref:Uncharacterized protein n=1 Tax=Menopon gallinae TaxID=328185 RepID=A0AAW2H645_9NEOP
MGWFKKATKKLWNVGTMGAGKEIYKGIFGKKDNGADKEASNVLKENVQGAKDTANKLEDLGIKQAQDANKLREMLMEGLKQQKQNLQPMLDNINKGFNQAKDNQTAYLASIGYRPDTNNVFNKATAELEGQRNNTLTEIQNQANQQNFNNILQGLQLGNKYQAHMQNQANKNNALLGLLGTLGGALVGGPIGAGAGGFLSNIFKQGGK